MKVSVLILTFNEELNLPACLAALSWCDDVLVVDSGSVDDTLNIAAAYGARILERPFDSFANQRNFGLEAGAFKNEWVLHLDADEVVTPAFIAALDQLQAPVGIDAYQVPSKTMFFGRWLRYAGMWPSYQVRLGHRDRLRFTQVGHGQREALPSERVGMFAEAYLHYSFSQGLEPWLRKHLRYAADEADELVRQRTGAAAPAHGGGIATGRRAIKSLVGRLPLTQRPFLKFFYVYIVRAGFLDGGRGFAYAFMLGVYEGMIAVIAIERLNRLRGSNRATAPGGGRPGLIQTGGSVVE